MSIPTITRKISKGAVLKSFRRLLGEKVSPEYYGAIINPGDKGNNIIDLEFDAPIHADGNAKSGFTFECKASKINNSWKVLDPGAYGAFQVDPTTIRVVLKGTVNNFQTSHELRVSYDDAWGDINGLETFTGSTALQNNSTVDLLSGVTSSGPYSSGTWGKDIA